MTSSGEPEREGARPQQDDDDDRRSVRSMAVGSSKTPSTSLHPRAASGTTRTLPTPPDLASAFSRPSPSTRSASESTFSTSSGLQESSTTMPALPNPPPLAPSSSQPQHSSSPSISTANSSSNSISRYPTSSSSSNLRSGGPAPPTSSIRSSRSSRVEGGAQPSPKPIRKPVMPKQIKEPIVPWNHAGSTDVPVAKTSSLYCSLTPMYGFPPPVLKAHTSTLVGDKIYVIGGASSSKGGCFGGVATFNIHTMRWDQLKDVKGESPPPIRAHTSTAIGHTIWVFGGGDEMTYSADMFAFNTLTHTWSLPKLDPSSPQPVPRRAHSASFLAPSSLVIFGGGDGHTALNDTWIFDTSTLTWREIISPPARDENGEVGREGGDAVKRGPVPDRRGYHSGHVVDGKLVIFGGGNGQKTFDTVEVLDLKTKVWHNISPPPDPSRSRKRAYHAAMVIGNLLFVVGGHDSKQYQSDILCFDLRRKKWTTKHLAGNLYPGRGYHSSTFADGRIFILGGSDETTFFSDMWTIDLGASAGLAFLPPIMIHLD
ncbi:hypothetical protein BDY24DRAFT_387057 [Mrakia frigida]|uniref:Kelch repeat-containing protein n=1 Tax=Mrakia frigida TaxID=29902 RepID=UPI003FCBFCCD